MKVPSACGVMMVCKKGMEPSALDSSTLNWMEGSIELMCCFTKVSSTYLFHILGGSMQLWWFHAQKPPCRWLNSWWLSSESLSIGKNIFCFRESKFSKWYTTEWEKYPNCSIYLTFLFIYSMHSIQLYLL